VKEEALSLRKAVSDHFFPTFRDTPEVADPSLASFFTWKQFLLSISPVLRGNTSFEGVSRAQYINKLRNYETDNS
jgi:hypothetical protein